MTNDEIDAAGKDLSILKPNERAFSIFENWPGWLFYTPIACAWLWYGLRFRGLTLPALADPSIELGGLCGESKKEVYALLGAEGHRRLAPVVFFKTTGSKRDDLKRIAASLVSLPH